MNSTEAREYGFKKAQDLLEDLEKDRVIVDNGDCVVVLAVLVGILLGLIDRFMGYRITKRCRRLFREAIKSVRKETRARVCSNE